MTALLRWIRLGVAVAAVLRAALGPWLDFAIRLWLAQAFLVALVHQVMLGETQAGLVGTDLGRTLQALCPVLLAVGLLARPVAALMVAAIVATPGLGDAGLFWTALLLRIAVIGPGAFSLDRALHRGAESLAVPGVAVLHRAFEWARRAGDPAYLLGLRLWLAAAAAGIALADLAGTSAMQPGVAPFLPHVPPMVGNLGAAPAMLLAALLALGLATRPAALVLLALVPLGGLMSTEARLYWALLLAIVAVHGGGPVSLDAVLARWALRRMAPVPAGPLPHIVVVGGGFGGVATVAGLRHAACRVTLIDRRNHHLFQPLLYQVATAGLSPADIATPIRGLFRSQANVRVLLGEVTGVDIAGRRVLLAQGDVPFDHLVLATGARHGYFGRDDWAPFAPGLKTIEDAITVRGRLLRAFEQAEAATPADRAALLTFVIVGGGPTGVELAGTIAELARHGLTGEFRSFDPASARVLLVQSGPRLLPAFPESLSLEAARSLRHLGVVVLLDRKVEEIGADFVVVSGERIAARTVLWAAGVMASPAAAWLGTTPDRAGRVLVGPDLGVPGMDGVFVVGDTAASTAWGGLSVPGLAPAAKQGGAYVARVIRARLEHRTPPHPFRYRHFGSLATIGRQAAVADFGLVRLRGALAWWLWGAAHVAFLVGGRNRLTVLLEWFWAYLTFRRGTRLITGTD